MRSLQSLVTQEFAALDSYNVHQCVADVCENILRAADADHCVIYLLERANQELRSGAFVTRDRENILERRMKVGSGVAGWVAAHREPLVLERADLDGRYLEEWQPTGGNGVPVPAPTTVSILALPLVAFDSFVGVLELVRENGRAAFTGASLGQLQPLANIAGMAIPRDADDGFARLAEVCIRFLEEKDRYTHGHSIRVMKYSLVVAEAAHLPKSQMEELRLCALLHDIGKVVIKDTLLSKPGRLTAKELQTVRMHPTIGFNIVERISRTLSRKIRSHHERFDGKGYPDGLVGDQIPLASRIICVADSLDAITSDRPYRSARDLAYALEEIRNNSGTQFDPELVKALLAAADGGRLQLHRF